MASIEFQGFPKIARFNRPVVITEKIDGTNAAIRIVPMSEIAHWVATEHSPAILFDPDAKNAVAVMDDWVVFAQSRKRMINTEFDNYGFAKWVSAHAEELVHGLGEGIHYGEWWGSGIQRKYGLTGDDKRFSLFNVGRWGEENIPSCVSVVPTLAVAASAARLNDLIEHSVDYLRKNGSEASPGFMNPEGIVIYHEAGRHTYKVMLESDDLPKSCVAA